MTKVTIRRFRPGRGALVFAASAVLVGGLAFSMGHGGAVHAQTGTATATAGAPPPPPPPPPPPAPARSATPSAPPAPPAAPVRTATPAAAARTATAQAPAAQRPVAPAAPAAKPALPNTGTGGLAGHNDSIPMLPVVIGFGALALVGGSLALRSRKNEG
ncbi:MAG TPA: hypothetical protein VIO16_15265 [Dehalococcoidia bacterium]